MLYRGRTKKEKSRPRVDGISNTVHPKNPIRAHLPELRTPKNLAKIHGHQEWISAAWCGILDSDMLHKGRIKSDRFLPWVVRKNRIGPPFANGHPQNSTNIWVLIWCVDGEIKKMSVRAREGGERNWGRQWQPCRCNLRYEVQQYHSIISHAHIVSVSPPQEWDCHSNWLTNCHNSLHGCWISSLFWQHHVFLHG